MKFYSIIPRILQTVAWGPTQILLHFFCSFEIRGRENLHGLHQAIFACNHAGEWDPIVLTAATLPLGYSPMFYVGAPDKEFNDHMFGWRRHLYKSWFFRSWGSYPLVRGMHDYAASLATHERILKDGYSLCIFPEGGVSRDGQIREGKGGVAYLAYATGVPIIPVYIAGTHNTPLSAITTGKRKISVSFSAPITVDVQLNAEVNVVDEYKKIAQHTMQSIAEMQRLS